MHAMLDSLARGFIKGLIGFGSIGLVIALSYQLAMWGEPQSRWLWCDVLGVIETN